MGILTGSAIAAGLLIVTLGLPEFPATPAEPTVQEEPVVEQAPAPPETAAPDPTTGIEARPLVDDSPNDPPPADITGAAALPGPVAAAQQAPQPEEANWYAFWSPFRSEIAADGFVTELQRTTGLDYRVVKLKPGVYEVAFAYSDDNDIQEKLTRIATATGLDLGGG